MPTLAELRRRLSARSGWLDPAIAVGLAGVYLALLLVTAPGLGYARDEGFYFAAADSYERWFEVLFEDGLVAFEPGVVDRFWSANHEHPALMKTLFALSHRYLYSAWHWFDEPGTAYRFPAMVMSALAIAVTYLWARALTGRVAAVLAAALLAAMPRVFYHSHLACFDMPVAALWLCTAFAYARSFERAGLGWAVATGVLYGLLLNTKHNAWLLPPALVLHYALIEAPRLRRGFAEGRPRLPLGLLVMLLIGPLVFYLGWPWIWRDTLDRLREYAQFHLGHDYYNMEFLGRTYWKPPMPRLYAPLMTLATVPLATLLAFAAGVVLWLRSLGAGRFAPSASPHQLLWALCILTSYGPWLSTDTPIFGGTKHWLTAYPFLCLFAALTLDRLLRALPELCRGRAARLRPALPGLVSAAVLAGPVVMTAHSQPWGLSAYTPLVGGAAGAATLGLNRTFWGYTTGALTDYINAVTPARGTVFVHDTALQSWAMLVRDGRVRSDIRASLNVAGSDLALYHHEPHMSKVEYQIWVDYGTVAPADIGTFDGVPVVWIYRRPEDP